MDDRLGPEDADDDWLWLEEVLGQPALDWARARNAQTVAQLQQWPGYARLREQILAVELAQDRIPALQRAGEHVYQLWQDARHRHGLWRRARLSEYAKPEPCWDLLLDLDALSQQEGESWFLQEARFLAPHNERCLLLLSRGGADAAVLREFDLPTRQFVSAAGFTLAEAKTEAHWLDADTVLVATELGPDSLTHSGYPRMVLRWQRGTPLNEASCIFEGGRDDVSVGAWVDRSVEPPRVLLSRALDFFRQQTFILQQGQLRKLDLPDTCAPCAWGEWLLLRLHQDWRLGACHYPAGALLACKADAFLAGARQFLYLFTPTPGCALTDFALTANHVLLNISDQVVSRLEEWRLAGPGAPQRRQIQTPQPGTLRIDSLWQGEATASIDDPMADSYLLRYADFRTPESLYLCRAGCDERLLLKARAAQFDAKDLLVEQHHTRSADGTRIPYFIVQTARPTGPSPTLLYGYGGFELAVQPDYDGSRGRAWLERGGCFVLANIRGGGEFGPAWHQAAIGAHKQRSYDDFIAVAEDLLHRQVCTPRQLGLMGASNGGLLVAATFFQRPELFNAVVCQVPLLDMRRYHRLLAGASWLAEYGDPDEPADWAHIRRYSPYHAVQRDRRYPRPFFTTSTRDDRVHPGHARKMVARMLAQGHPVLYYEALEGGHSGTDPAQLAELLALEYSYLWLQLGSTADDVSSLKPS